MFILDVQSIAHVGEEAAAMMKDIRGVAIPMKGRNDNVSTPSSSSQ